MSRRIDHHFLKRSFMKGEPCADLVYMKENRDSLFFAMADVAGHGARAHELSLVIQKYFEKYSGRDLMVLMKGLHVLLKGSRGAVGLVGRLLKRTGTIRYVGIGNISMRKLGATNFRVIVNEGILGYVIPTPRVQRLRLSEEEILLVYTDGVQDHFEASECPEDLFDKEAKGIAKAIMKRFNKGNDDAACIAIRYKNDRSR